VVEGDEADPVAVQADPEQRLGQGVGVEALDQVQPRLHAEGGEVPLRRQHRLAQVADEGVAAGRQDDVELQDPAARQQAGGQVGGIVQPLHHRMDPARGLGIHAVAAVQHPVDRGQADSGLAGDVDHPRLGGGEGDGLFHWAEPSLSCHRRA
jgi:hypothetical protein